jgi:hypothetical protein
VTRQKTQQLNTCVPSTTNNSHFLHTNFLSIIDSTKAMIVDPEAKLKGGKVIMPMRY